MTGHARKCILEDRLLKAYQTDHGAVMLFFNCVHDLVGARFGSNYIACENFDIDHKASVKRLKEHVYNRLEDIPYDYVMKDDAPERIPLGTGAAVGPSVVSVDARQPNSIADNLEAYEGYQGAGAADNFHSDGFNLVTEPIYTHANYGPMNSGPLNTYDCQGQGIPPPRQQQITLPSIGPEWQQNAQVSEDSPDPFEWATMNPMLQQSSEASTSAQPNLEPHHLPQLLQTPPAAAPAWTVAQPPFLGQDQGPDCSAFPGSGHGNGW
jgi:hypothetical protein